MIVYVIIAVAIVMTFNTYVFNFINSAIDFKLRFNYAKERIQYKRHLLRINQYVKKGYVPPATETFRICSAFTSKGTNITIPINYLFGNVSMFSVDLRKWLKDHGHPTDVIYARVIHNNGREQEIILDLVHDIDLVSNEELLFGSIDSILCNC